VPTTRQFNPGKPESDILCLSIPLDQIPIMTNEDNEDPSVQLSNRVVRENQTTLKNMIISRKIDPECMIFAEGNIV
jgi:hypothetical protein